MAHTTRRRRLYESSELVPFLRRMARAFVRRAGEGDLEALSSLVEIQQAMDTAIGECARALHECGYSWTDIAREIGTTRQNAQKRFTTKGEA